MGAFLAFRGQLEGISWEQMPDQGRRAEVLTGGPKVRAPCLREESQTFNWEDIDEGPPDTDDSWAPFAPKDQFMPDGKMLQGGKKLTKEQKQKLKDAEQLAEARDNIRKRGWTDGEVKWRSWLARRGHDTMVHDWNLYQYIDGECIPPSRDPFWINANEVPLPDYEAGNDVPNEVGPMEVTNILGERIEPKWKPPRMVELQPLWLDVDAATLVEQGLGRVTEDIYWRQTLGMVYVEVKVPEGTSARELQVTIAPSRLTIRVGTGSPIFDKELYMKIYVGSNVDNESCAPAPLFRRPEVTEHASRPYLWRLLLGAAASLLRRIDLVLGQDRCREAPLASKPGLRRADLAWRSLRVPSALYGNCRTSGSSSSISLSGTGSRLATCATRPAHGGGSASRTRSPSPTSTRTASTTPRRTSDPTGGAHLRHLRRSRLGSCMRRITQQSARTPALDDRLGRRGLSARSHGSVARVVRRDVIDGRPVTRNRDDLLYCIH